VDTSSTKIFGDEAVQPLTTPQLTEVFKGRLPYKTLVLLLPVRDARLGARGGGDVEEAAHRFFSPVSPAARARFTRLETGVYSSVGSRNSKLQSAYWFNVNVKS